MYFSSPIAFLVLGGWLWLVIALALKRLDRALLIPVLIAPAYLLRFHLAGIPTTVLELTIYALVFVIFARLAASRDKDYRNRFSIPGRLLLVVSATALVLGAVIATAFSQEFLTSLGILKGWFFDPLLYGAGLLTAAFYLIPLFQQRRLSRQLLQALFVSGSLTAIIALGFVAAGQFTFDGRLRAFYQSPNQLAMLLSPALLAGLVFSFHNRKGLIRRLLAPAFTALGIALFLTFSIGAWLGTLGGGLIFLFHNRNRLLPSQKKAALAAVIILLLALAGSLLLTADAGKLAAYRTAPDRSPLASRLIIWRVGLKIALANPVIGIGPGTFQNHYLARQNQFPPYLEWASPQPHNLWLAFWLQTGLLGLLGFVGLTGWLLIVNTKTAGPNNTASVLLALLATTLIHGLIDTPYWRNDLALIFWLLVAITLLSSSLAADSVSLSGNRQQQGPLFPNRETADRFIPTAAESRPGRQVY